MSKQFKVNGNGSNVSDGSDVYNSFIVTGVTTNHTGGENNQGIIVVARLVSTALSSFLLLSFSPLFSLLSSCLINCLSIQHKREPNYEEKLLLPDKIYLISIDKHFF